MASAHLSGALNSDHLVQTHCQAPNSFWSGPRYGAAQPSVFGWKAPLSAFKRSMPVESTGDRLALKQEDFFVDGGGSEARSLLQAVICVQLCTAGLRLLALSDWKKRSGLFFLCCLSLQWTGER